MMLLCRLDLQTCGLGCYVRHPDRLPADFSFSLFSSSGGKLNLAKLLEWGNEKSSEKARVCLSLVSVSCFLFLVQKFTGREIERPREGLAQCVMQTILVGVLA